MILVAGVLLALAAAPGGAPQEPLAPQALLQRLTEAESAPPGERRARLDELAALGRGPLSPALETAVAQKTEVSACLLDLLARVGTGEDLSLVLELAPGEPDADSRPGAAFTNALAALLDRAPQAHAALATPLREAPPALRRAFLRGIEAARKTQGLVLVTECLGASPAADAELLGAAGRIGASLAPPFPAAALGEVRRYLRHAEAALVREAALAAGALEDEAAVELLIESLARDDTAVAAASHRALVQITGLRLPRDPARWRSWYADESEWQAREAPLAVDDLGSPDPACVARALREVGGRRLGRRLFVPSVAAVLERQESGLVRLACSVLARLGGAAEVPALVELLDDHDPEVAGAAQRALRQLTGLDPHRTSPSRLVAAAERRGPAPSPPSRR